MNPDLQRRVQRYGWDRAAPHYEKGWQDQLWPAQEEMIKESNLSPGEQVLEISCGTGLVTIPIAKAVHSSGSVLATDLSEGMIEIAKERCENQKLDHVSFARMDAEDLDVTDRTFDIAICALGFMYFPLPEKALMEMYRALKPGGRAIVLIWGARKNCGWADIFPIVDRRVNTDVCPLFFQLGTGNQLSQLFEEVGFDDIRSNRFSISLCYNSDEQACIGAFRGGPVAMAYKNFDEETKKVAHSEYLDSIKPFENKGGYDIPGEFVIVKGRK